jgi:hypothetical protein
MQQLETDLNYISSLADQPAMATAELKAQFDMAGNAIKDYINNLLIPSIATDIATSLATAKAYVDNAVGSISTEADAINYDNTTSGLAATNVQDAIDEINVTLGNASSTANSKVKYTDFTITEHAIRYTNYGGAYDVQKTLDIANQGYMPLAIVGHSNNAIRNTYSVNWDWLSSRSAGAATITYKYRYDYQGGGTQTFDAKWYVLWVKIS